MAVNSMDTKANYGITKRNYFTNDLSYKDRLSFFLMTANNSRDPQK